MQGLRLPPRPLTLDGTLDRNGSRGLRDAHWPLSRLPGLRVSLVSLLHPSAHGIRNAAGPVPCRVCGRLEEPWARGQPSHPAPLPAPRQLQELPHPRTPCHSGSQRQNLGRCTLPEDITGTPTDPLEIRTVGQPLSPVWVNRALLIRPRQETHRRQS